MADFFGYSFDFAGTASSFVDWLTYIFIIALVMSLLWGCLYVLSFRHLVRIRIATASGYVIIDTKAREFTKNGVKYWRFLKPKWIKQKHPAPENSYLEFTGKGKISAEADLSMDGVVHWRRRSGKPDTSDDFTSAERVLTIQDTQRANDYLKTGFGQQLLAMAPTIMTIIILVLVLAFWGDLTKTATDAIARSAAMEERNAQAGERLAEASERLACAMGHCFGNQTNNGLIIDNKGQNLPPIPN